MVYFLPHFVFLNYYHYSLLFLPLLCLKVNSNELGSTLVKTSSTHNTISLILDHILRGVAFIFILLVIYKVLQQLLYWVPSLFSKSSLPALVRPDRKLLIVVAELGPK